MSATAAPPAALGTPPNYLNSAYGWKSWLFTKDHKRIALLYLVSVTLMFFVGGAFAVAIRLELVTPRGDLLSADNYNKAFSLHGIIMIFFFLIPSIPATLGNFLMPMMVGARDLAFPRINLLSWYLFVIGACIGICAAIFGGVDTGWTFYTPYSSTYSNSNVALTIDHCRYGIVVGALGVEHFEVAGVACFVAQAGNVERLAGAVYADVLGGFGFAVFAQADQGIPNFLVGGLQGVLPGDQGLLVEGLGLIDRGCRIRNTVSVATFLSTGTALTAATSKT